MELSQQMLYSLSLSLIEVPHYSTSGYLTHKIIKQVPLSVFYHQVLLMGEYHIHNRELWTGSCYCWPMLCFVVVCYRLGINPYASGLLCWHIEAILKGMFTDTRSRRGWRGGGKLASTQIIVCIHTYAVAERRRRRSGIKISSATNGSNTQFSTSASKPRAPDHICPQEMADPPASAPRMCEHSRGSRAGM